MVGTIFEKSRTPLQLWFYAMFLFTSSRHGVSGKELQRQLGVTYKTAWRMAKLIREHMAAVDGDRPIGGEGKIVEIDETYVGGDESGARRRSCKNKTIVLGTVERGGNVISKVVPDATKPTLQKAIKEAVARGTEIHTDAFRSYMGLEDHGYEVRRVNKYQGDGYVGRNGETVNAIENFWRHLKCSIEGTHTSVSRQHLER